MRKRGNDAFYRRTKSLDAMMPGSRGYPDVSLGEALDDIRDWDITRREIRKRVSKMDEPDRTIIQLWMQGLTQRQIASRVNRAQPTVHKSIHRTIKRIRENLIP